MYHLDWNIKNQLEVKVQVLVNKGGLVSAVCTSIAELLKQQCGKGDIELKNNVCVSSYATHKDQVIADPDEEETKHADSVTHVAVYADGSLLVDYEKKARKGISLTTMKKIVGAALEFQTGKQIEEAMVEDEEAFRIIFQRN